MHDEKKVTRKTIDPVVDQKIIKDNRSKWILWLLPLLALLLLFIWFIHHHQNDTRSAPQVAENSNSLTTADKINAWYAADKNADSGWIALDSISFRSGSADPVIDDSGQLEKIADTLNRHPKTRVVIRGFADATGPQELNDNLSAQRANAVRMWLTEHNVRADRLSIDGRGASAPVASNATEQGREMNRRVALKILSGK